MITAQIGDLIPDAENANRGTPRGRGMVEDSLRRFGAGRSVLVDKHMRLIAGNKTAEAAGGIGLADVIVIPTDGTQLVVVQRTDLDLETDLAARQLALADNRTAEVGLEWDAETLARLVAAEPKMTEGLWTEEEIGVLLDVRGSLEEKSGEGAIVDSGTTDQCPKCGYRW